MRQPEVLITPPGHPIVTFSSSEFPGLLGSLRSKMLPPDKSPYADNKDGDIGRMAWNVQMTSAKKSDQLEEQAQWLIDVLLPRAIMGPDGGVYMVPIEEPRSHGNLRIMLNELPNAVRMNDDVITAGGVLAHPRTQFGGNDYLPVIHTEEPPMVAVAVMRVLRMEAYMSLLFCPDIEHGGVAIHEGVAVFPDDHTLLSFGISRMHAPIIGLAVLSDPTVMATQWLRNADQVMRRELIHLDANVARDLINDQSVDTIIQLIKAKAAMASFLSPEHAELEPFLAKVHEARLDWKGLLTHHHVGARLDNLVAQISQHGVAVSGCGGITPESISQYLKMLVDAVANGYFKSGPNHEYVVKCHDMLATFVTEMPTRFGFPIEQARAVLKYMETQLGVNANSAAIPARIFAADAEEWNICLAGTYRKQMRSDLEALGTELKAGPVEQDAAVAKVKSTIDKFAEGARRCGQKNELIAGGETELASFITKVLPAYKFPQPAVAELVAYAKAKFDPNSAENLDYEAAQVEEGIVRSIATLEMALAANLGPKQPEAVKKITADVTGMIDLLAEHSKRVGPGNQHMVNANTVLRNLVTIVLPKHGLPPETIVEIKRYARAKLA
jgi:hypothetical protein